MVEVPKGLPQWIADHIQQYLDDPEAAHLWDATLGGGSGKVPTLLLISKGRKTGEDRPLPLIYGQVDGGYAIIASKGGAPDHPAWYLNLKAEPSCRVHVASAQFEAVAREAEGEERDRIWNQMVGIYAPYEDYQKATDRKIPVIVLEPR